MAIEASSCSLASTSVTCVGVVGALSSIGEGVLFGSFAGSVVFVLSKTELTLLQRWAYLLVSMICGVISGPFVSSLFEMTFAGLQVSQSLGALIASSLAVKILTAAITAEDIASFFRRKGS